MASSIVAKIICTIIVCMGITMPHIMADISCDVVSTSMNACLTALIGLGSPSTLCCDNLMKLNDMATTTEDRQDECTCMQSLISSVANLNVDEAANLPVDCNVNLPYDISVSTNCAAVV